MTYGSSQMKFTATLNVTVKHMYLLLKAVPDYDKIVTAMSQSKAFNIAGLMFSNLIIPNRRLLKTWKLHHFSSENPLSIVATQAAYEKGEDWLVAMNDYLDDNFKYLAQF